MGPISRSFSRYRATVARFERIYVWVIYPLTSMACRLLDGFAMKQLFSLSDPDARDEAATINRARGDLRPFAIADAVDSLTGLGNRRWLDVALVNAMATSRFAEHTLAVLAFAIDGLCVIHARFGEHVGNVVVREFAATLRTHCCESDIVVRLDENGFVLVLADTSAVEAAFVARRIRKQAARRDWTRVVSGLAVSISAGIAVDPGKGSALSLVRAASEALARSQSGAASSRA